MNGNQWVRAAATAFTLTLTTAVQAQSSDSILSKHIREADGTSGQDTNSGAGIKEGHLQNGAVTALKLAPAAVGTAAIADGAVTDSKIAGPISGAKVGKAGLDADMLDGFHAGAFSTVMHGHVASDVEGLPEVLAAKSDAGHDHDAIYRRKHSKVIVVADDGAGDFLDPAQALASITDASADRPYLIKILPGVYQLSQPMSALPYVDLEGSGEGVTVLRYAPEALDMVAFRLAGSSEVRALTLAADNVQMVAVTDSVGSGPIVLRNITVRMTQNRGSLQASVGLCLQTAAGAVMSHVTVRVAGASAPINYANQVWGLEVNCPTSMSDVDVETSVATHQYALMLNRWATNVEVNASRFVSDAPWEAYTVFGGAPNVRMRNTTIRASVPADAPIMAIGVLAVEGEIRLENCEVEATSPNRPAYAVYGGGPVSMAYSRLVGQVYDTGTLRCLGNYDANLAPVTCQ